MYSLPKTFGAIDWVKSIRPGKRQSVRTDSDYVATFLGDVDQEFLLCVVRGAPNPSQVCERCEERAIELIQPFGLSRLKKLKGK